MHRQVIRNVRFDGSCNLAGGTNDVQQRSLYLTDGVEVLPITQHFVNEVDRMPVSDIDWMAANLAVCEVCYSF